MHPQPHFPPGDRTGNRHYVQLVLTIEEPIFLFLNIGVETK
jgi:hypothetical protein